MKPILYIELHSRLTGEIVKTRQRQLDSKAAAARFWRWISSEYFGTNSAQYVQYCVHDGRALMYRPINNPFEYKVYYK